MVRSRTRTVPLNSVHGLRQPGSSSASWPSGMRPRARPCARSRSPPGRYQEVADFSWNCRGLWRPRSSDAAIRSSQAPTPSAGLGAAAVRRRAAGPLAGAFGLSGDPRAGGGTGLSGSAQWRSPARRPARRWAGWVLALPAGLGDWAPDWPGWSHWGAFLGGLVDWAAGGGEPLAARLDLQSDGRRRLQIDRTDPAGTWSRPPP